MTVLSESGPSFAADREFEEELVEVRYSVRWLLALAGLGLAFGIATALIGG